jgi:hypothetical protein
LRVGTSCLLQPLHVLATGVPSERGRSSGFLSLAPKDRKACSVPSTAANATRRARLSPQEGLSTAVRGTHRAFADAMSGLSARKDVRHRGLARYSAASPKAPYPDSPVCRSSAIDGYIMTAAAGTAPACLTILPPSGDGSRTPPCHPKCLSTPVNGVATARQRRDTRRSSATTTPLLSPAARLHIASPSSLRLNAHRRSCAARSLRAA